MLSARRVWEQNLSSPSRKAKKEEPHKSKIGLTEPEVVGTHAAAKGFFF